MGSGKTTVGRLLAATMSLRFIDLDRAIEERAGQSVPAIFAAHGEAGFRRLEAEELRRAARRQGLVVATGGGVMTAAANRRLMDAAGVTVWLDAGFETLARRVAAQPEVGRPLFTDRRQAEELFRARRPDYARARMRVAVGAADGAEEVAERIAGMLREARCAT